MIETLPRWLRTWRPPSTLPDTRGLEILMAAQDWVEALTRRPQSPDESDEVNVSAVGLLHVEIHGGLRRAGQPSIDRVAGGLVCLRHHPGRMTRTRSGAETVRCDAAPPRGAERPAWRVIDDRAAGPPPR